MTTDKREEVRMEQDEDASLRDRAATPSEPSPAVSGAAGIPSAERDEIVSFVVKVPAQRGWHRWSKVSFRSVEDAEAAAQQAAANHSRARIVERRMFIQERIVKQVEAINA